MQRRRFIHHFLWLTGGLAAGCNKHLNASAASLKSISGKVTTAGAGMENVVVSDGFSVVKTSADGSFTMDVTAKSEHVFVSIPSGYAFPHEKNIARHYRVIKAGNSFDFQLERLNVSDQQHKFMIWADPQVKNDSDVKKLLTESVPDVQEYMRSLPTDSLIHGICVGDIVWDSPSLFTSYNTAVEKCGLPFFQTIGNHDMDYKGGDENSDDTFKSHYGPSYYSFNRGDVHYVVLDDVYYLGTDREYKGYITEEQLAWLRKDLSFVPADKLIVISTHIPVHNAVENNQALYSILAPYKVHIMSGHTHYNRNVINGNVYEHVHGTVCGAWWTGPICGDGTPPGYAIYEVNGTELKWHYKSTGKARDQQIRGIIQGDVNGQTQLYANVWNWDSAWKVEWQVDGVNKGVLPRISDYDPVAVLLYKGDNLPLSRTFVEPDKTDHLFKVQLPQGATQVKIFATDRFGNQYQFTA